MGLRSGLKSTKNSVEFVKFSSFGNDFLILTDESYFDKSCRLSELARCYCDRHYGVGADGLLSWKVTGDDYRLRIFNADGSEAAMCGNGLRAWVSWWVLLHRDSLVEHFEITTLAGRFPVIVHQLRCIDLVDTLVEQNSGVDKDGVEVSIGWLQHPKLRRCYQWGDRYHVEDWDSGVAHAVLWVDALPDNWLELSEQLAGSECYRASTPSAIQNTNIDWVVSHGDDIDIFTWEHGVGHSLACGTGSVAVAASYWAKTGLAGDGPMNAQIGSVDGNVAVTISYSGIPTATVVIERDSSCIWLRGSMAQPVCQGFLL